MSSEDWSQAVTLAWLVKDTGEWREDCFAREARYIKRERDRNIDRKLLRWKRERVYISSPVINTLLDIVSGQQCWGKLVTCSGTRQFNYKIHLIAISFSYREKFLVKLQLLIKMLTIAKEVPSEYSITWRFDWFLFQIALTALKYETKMFQEFRTQNSTQNCFIYYLLVCTVYT